LVEGQSEYLLLHALGEAFNFNLDQHGIAVVDFQNNGSLGIYAAFADAFGIPWRMITDGDSAGGFIEEMKNRGFNDADIAAHVTALKSYARDRATRRAGWRMGRFERFGAKAGKTASGNPQR
jgi:putative ATP-dependent endonuclease of the OLD family